MDGDNTHFWTNLRSVLRFWNQSAENTSEILLEIFEPLNIHTIVSGLSIKESGGKTQRLDSRRFGGATFDLGLSRG